MLFFFVSIFPSNVEGITKTVIDVCWGLVCLFLFILSMMYSLWYIKFEDNAISGRNYIGRKYRILISDLDCYERLPNGKLIFLKDNKKRISIEPEYADTVLLWVSAKTKLSNRKKMKGCGSKIIIVRPAKYHQIISDIILFGFLLGLMLEIYCNNYIGICMCIGLSVFGIINCFYQYTEKYIVGNGYIEYDLFSRKKAVIPYSDVSRVEIKQGDNVSYLLFFSKTSKKPILRVNTYYDNAFELKELAYKMKWLVNTK